MIKREHLNGVSLESYIKTTYFCINFNHQNTLDKI